MTALDVADRLCADLMGSREQWCRAIVARRVASTDRLHDAIASTERSSLPVAYIGTLRSQLREVLNAVYDDTRQLAATLPDHEASARDICWVSDTGSVRCMPSTVLLAFYQSDYAERILVDLDSVSHRLGIEDENRTIVSCGGGEFGVLDEVDSLDDDPDATGVVSAAAFRSGFTGNEEAVAAACEAPVAYGGGATGFGPDALGGPASPSASAADLFSCMASNSGDDFLARQDAILDATLTSCTGEASVEGPIGLEALMEGDAGTTSDTVTTTDDDGTETTTITTTNDEGTTTTTRTTSTDANENTTVTTTTVGPDGSRTSESRTTRPDGTTSRTSRSAHDANGNGKETVTTHDENGQPTQTQIYESTDEGGKTTVIYHERREDGLQMEVMTTDEDGWVTGAKLYYRPGYEPEPQGTWGTWDCTFDDNCSSVCSGAVDVWGEMLTCAANPDAPICQSYADKSCECSAFASDFVDPRIVLTDPQGDFICAGDYDATAQAQACEAQCQIDDCTSSCVEADGSFVSALVSPLGNYCLYAIADDYEWCRPLEQPSTAAEAADASRADRVSAADARSRRAVDLSGKRLLRFP